MRGAKLHFFYNEKRGTKSAFKSLRKKYSSVARRIIKQCKKNPYLKDKLKNTITLSHSVLL